MHRGRAAFAALLAAGCAAAEPSPPPPSRAITTLLDAPPPDATGARPSPGAAPLLGAAYDGALAAIGLNRADARCSPRERLLYEKGRFPTALYLAIQEDPAMLDGATEVFRRGALAVAPRAADTLGFAAARADASVRWGLLGDPLAHEVEECSKPGAFARALAGDRAADPPAGIDTVPPVVQAAAALVLRAAERARPWLDRAFDGMDPYGFRKFGWDAPRREAADATLLLARDEDDDRLRALFEKEAAALDTAYLARAAAEVLAAADRAADLLAAAPPSPPFEFRQWTSLGEVLLRGGGDDADGPDDDGPFLLRIDTGGNDRYAAGASAMPIRPISVLLDAGGDDVYEGPPDAAAFGAGFLGVGALLDLAGNDRYALRGPRSLGLGAGVFGAGVLVDRAGDDVYEGDAFCMGAGAAGFGALSDLAGSDRYRAMAYAQGFGFVRGGGLLVDVTGDDVYVADDEDIRRPSPQTKEHNTSLAQGFGYGVRADYLDGHSLAGGVGLLVDGEGNDAYSCGVFGQGGGYWMGVGMLLDGGGDDRYAGVWYVQGASAHFAVGVLEDAGGSDDYVATHNMAQGAGHDFSVGMLLDRGDGADVHRAPNLSLGAGNMNGVGVFADGGGDDAYETKGATLGLGRCREGGRAVPTLRHRARTLGVFLDLGGGGDRYTLEGGGTFAADGATWTQDARDAALRYADEVGVGVDR